MSADILSVSLIEKLLAEDIFNRIIYLNTISNKIQVLIFYSFKAATASLFPNYFSLF